MEAFRAYNAVLWDALEDGGEAVGDARAASLYIDLAATTGQRRVPRVRAAARRRARPRPPRPARGPAGGHAARLGREPRGGARLRAGGGHPLPARRRAAGLRARGRARPARRGRRARQGGGREHAVLAVVRHGEIVIVRAVAATERPSLADALRRVKGLNIGVSTIQDNLAGIPDAYREASLAARPRVRRRRALARRPDAVRVPHAAQQRRRAAPHRPGDRRVRARGPRQGRAC